MTQSRKIIANNKDKVPIIVEKDPKEPNLQALSQSKFLFPDDFTFFDFSQVVRKKMEIGENQTISFFFNNGKLYQSKNDN